MSQLLYDRGWMLEQVNQVCGKDTMAAILAVPEHMHYGALEYIVHGARAGDFLTAVFTNDLKEAVGRADGQNQRALVQWAQLLYWMPISPIRSWGSKADVQKWQETGGLLGLLKQNATDKG